MFADTLELKTEKQNAHSARITSVDFAPDGKTIVSGSFDKTLKVWGIRAFDESEWEEVHGEGTAQEGPKDRRGTFVLQFPYWKNKITGDLEQQKPKGGKPLGTHKV